MLTACNLGPVLTDEKGQLGEESEDAQVVSRGSLGERWVRRENSVEGGVGTPICWAPCPRQTLARVPWPLSHIVAQGGDPYYPPVIETCDSHKIKVQVRAGRRELLRGAANNTEDNNTSH